MILSKQQETDILRYYFAERWRVGTIARQLHLHHSPVERVIAKAGIPKPERSTAPDRNRCQPPQRLCADSSGFPGPLPIIDPNYTDPNYTDPNHATR